MADTENQSKLKAFVAGHVAIAAKKAPAEAEAHLIGWAEWVDRQIEQLGTDAAHLEGLTAFDLANARDELAAAAGRRAAA